MPERKKPVPLPETKIQIPVWTEREEGVAPATITATKRCLVTEPARDIEREHKLAQEITNIEVSQAHPQFATTSEARILDRFKAELVERQSGKPYTTANCPVYEIEKCAIPEADPGLQAANVEVCAVVKVDESSTITHEPLIQNRIIVRPAGCSVVKGDVESGGWTTDPEKRLITPTGEHAPEGIVKCVHTAAYVGPLEGIANVSDEQLSLKVGTEEALPPEIRFDPKMHFGSLWSYLEGILQEGIANVFQGAAGPGAAPTGFNSEMQKQVYQAIAKVAPNWAQNNLLPAILEAWLPHMPTIRHPEGVQDILNEAFHVDIVAMQNPAIADLMKQLFPTFQKPEMQQFHHKDYVVIKELASTPGTPENNYYDFETLYIVQDPSTGKIMLAATGPQEDAVGAEVDLNEWLLAIQRELGQQALVDVMRVLDKYGLRYTEPEEIFSFEEFAEELSEEAITAIEQNAPKPVLEKQRTLAKWEAISNKYSGGLTTFGG